MATASHSPVPVVLEGGEEPESDERRGALARLGRVLPAADAIVRFAYRTAAVSAVSVALILAVVVRWVLDVSRAGTTGTSELFVVLAGLAVVLLIPAGAAALAGWTLADLLRLPGQVREAARSAASGARGTAAVRSSRLAAVFRAVWAARGLALTSRDTWLKAAAAARFARLASLPFALALLGLFALNGVVILGGLVALVVLFL